MATNNMLNVGLLGSTGTGSFVGSNTPSLVTPNIGVATATSINLGVSTLNNYTELTSWTPTFTFVTVGDLSIAYTTQTGFYTRIGDVVYLYCYIKFTPTYTTASGQGRIASLPFAAALTSTTYGVAASITNTLAFPASRKALVSRIPAATAFITLSAAGSGVSLTNLSNAQFTSGTLFEIQQFNIYYV